MKKSPIPTQLSLSLAPSATRQPAAVESVSQRERASSPDAAGSHDHISDAHESHQSVEYSHQEFVVTRVASVQSEIGITQVIDPRQRLLALQDPKPATECEFRVAVRWGLVAFLTPLVVFGSGMNLSRLGALLFTESPSIVHSASLVVSALVTGFRLVRRRRRCPIGVRWSVAPLILLSAAALIAIPNPLSGLLGPLRWVGFPILAGWAFWPPLTRFLAFAKELVSQSEPAPPPQSINSILCVGRTVRLVVAATHRATRIIGSEAPQKNAAIKSKTCVEADSLSQMGSAAKYSKSIPSSVPKPGPSRGRTR